MEINLFSFLETQIRNNTFTLTLKMKLVLKLAEALQIMYKSKIINKDVEFEKVQVDLIETIATYT